MLDFNIEASKLFIEICDEERDPDIYLGLYCRKKFFTRYHSQNITKNPQSSSEYPYSLPFVRLHYWHLSVNFMSAFLGWKEFEKEAMPMMFHMALMPSFLHTGVQLPVLKNQCLLPSCFPSVMR